MNPPIPKNPKPIEQVEVQMPDNRKAAWAFVVCVLCAVAAFVVHAVHRGA